jgi:hypothetical protein
MVFAFKKIAPCKYYNLLFENESLLTKPNICNKIQHLQSHLLHKKYPMTPKLVHLIMPTPLSMKEGWLVVFVCCIGISQITMPQLTLSFVVLLVML